MLVSKNGGIRGVLGAILAMSQTPAFTGIDLPRTSVKRGKPGFAPYVDLPRTSVKRGKPGFAPYVDRAGISHGLTGDKLARKAAHGTIGLRNRGPYAAWHLIKR